MKFRSIHFLFLLIVANTAFSQTQHSGWLAAFNTFKMNDKFSLHFDAQLRSTDKFANVQTILLRPGINYKLSKKLTATVGYAYVAARRTVNSVTDYLPEHRIWEQLLYPHKIKQVAIIHRFRFEQRFLSTAYVSGNDLKVGEFLNAYRLRYFIRSIIPLKKTTSFNQGFFLALQDEIFVNIGDKSAVNGKFFDQNRAYGAVGFRFPSKIDIEAGYMYQYVSTRSSSTNIHIVQIAFYKRL